MNTKRQTVWLISMLSLMVVLSVYYLFTDNSSDPNLASDQTQKTDEASNIITNEVDSTLTDNKSTSGLAAIDKGITDITKSVTDTNDENAAALSPEDTKVLAQFNAQATSGDEYFAEQQLQRENNLSKEYERLMAIAADTEKDVATVSQAQDDLAQIQDEQAIITDLEDQLDMQYKNAIISKEENQWKVTVQSEKLQKSEAVSIIDKVMKELKIRSDQVIVSYIP